MSYGGKLRECESFCAVTNPEGSVTIRGNFYFATMLNILPLRLINIRLVCPL